MTEPAIGFNQAGYDEHKKVVREVNRRMMNALLIEFREFTVI